MTERGKLGALRFALRRPTRANSARRAADTGNRIHRSLGQSLVEFALVAPVLLLLTMFALDFGRIYLGWVNLQNMARIAANFAANNPEAWHKGDTTTETAYQDQILADAQAINCTLAPATPAAPTFTDADSDGDPYGLGDHATVSLTCHFQVLTPVISSILGGSVPVGASAVFPVKSALTATGGAIGGGGGCGVPPNPAIFANPQTGTAPPDLSVELRDASAGGAATAWLWHFGDGSPDSPLQFTSHTYGLGTWVVTLDVTNACGTFTSPPVTITVAAAPPPTPKLCTVPEFVAQGGTWRSAAQGIWQTAGFTTTVQGPMLDKKGHDYKIKHQDITGNSVVACDSTITVSP